MRAMAMCANKKLILIWFNWQGSAQRQLCGFLQGVGQGGAKEIRQKSVFHDILTFITEKNSLQPSASHKSLDWMKRNNGRQRKEWKKKVCFKIRGSPFRPATSLVSIHSTRSQHFQQKMQFLTTTTASCSLIQHTQEQTKISLDLVQIAAGHQIRPTDVTQIECFGPPTTN